MLPTSLPGASEPYLIRSGHGQREVRGDHHAIRIARHDDTNGLLEAAILSGEKGAGLATHRRDDGHEALMVLDGRLELAMGSERVVLDRGAFANIPPGTPHSYRMLGHSTRVLQWISGASVVTMLAPETSASDVPLLDNPPASATPYAIESGAGERLLAGDQLFAFLATQANTDGRFIVLSTIGPTGQRIPKHFHEHHTETFFCLDGIMTMWAGDEEVALAPGDFMHVPPGTIHSYRLDSPYTKFVGFLAPGLFEPFFRAMCEPYAGYMFPATPGPVRFDRVMAHIAELDLKLVERPGPPAP
jgi:quercetin 2,3-dioxygenase